MPISMHCQPEAVPSACCHLEYWHSGLSVLGQFEAGRADLSAVLGEACAEPKISSPCGKKNKSEQEECANEAPKLV